MTDKEKTDKEVRLECMGGWAFLMLGFGVIFLIPGVICMVIYGTDGTETNTQIIVSVTFAIGLAIMTIGLVISIVWCRISGYTKGGKKTDGKVKKAGSRQSVNA